MFNNFKQRFSNISVKVYLGVVYFTFLFILMVVLSFVVVGRSKEIMLKAVSNSQRQILQQVSERANTVKRSSITGLNLFAEDPYILDSLKKQSYDDLESYLYNQKKQYDDVFKETDIEYDLIILTPDGFNFHSGYTEDYNFEALRHQLIFKNVYDGGEGITSISSFNDKFGGDETNYVFSMSKDIFDDDGNVYAKFVITVKESILKQIYIDLIDDNLIYIVDEQGYIVSHENEDYLGLNYFSHENFEALYGGMKYKIVEKSSGSYLVTVVKNSETGWYVVEEIPTNRVFKDVFKLTNLIQIIIIAFFGLIFLITMGISRFLMNPIYKLSNTINKMRQGDLRIRTEGSFYKEVNDLNKTFDDMADQISDLIETTMVQEIYQKDLEMNFLRAQINPHFLYNTLFSMRCMADMERTDELLEMFDAFTGLLRATFSSDTKNHMLKSELETVEKYLQLQKMRYQNRIEYEIIIEEGIENYLVPPLILQPIVENAIFHGIEPKGDFGGITINTYQINSESLAIDIIDNGVGMTEEQIQKLNKKFAGDIFQPDESIGLANVANRLFLAFDQGASLEVISEVNFGTIIRIIIPKTGEEDEAINCR